MMMNIVSCLGSYKNECVSETRLLVDFELVYKAEVLVLCANQQSIALLGLISDFKN